MDEIQSRISSRMYAPGFRVPSVRAMAKAMHVSISTVLEAYERLALRLDQVPGSTSPGQ